VKVKKIMIKANVPVIPGYHGEEQSVEFLKKQAEKVGFPLMIKAVLGGGGKGMRIVNSLDEFEEKLESSKRESMKSFKDDRVLLERYIQSPRHIEFQIFADSHNGAIHCFERDCSIQRRHQKVIEEAPAFYLTPELRAKMGNIAVMAAKAVNYRGAGTVEFIMDTKTNDFFFMEMNTRLQVEHPVSEMILQKDFVQLQLHVAAGGKLPYTQDELQINGHAIEARIYAENPSNNFLPQVGHLVHFHPPQLSANVRLETHLRNGEEISMFYDPMIAKLITWASTRQQAISYMYKALSEFYIVGVATNIEFVKKCLLHSAFIKGDFDTNFIGQNLAQLIPTQSNIPIELSSSVTALALLLREAETRQHSSSSPWNSIQHFSTANRTTRQIELLQVGFVNNEEVETSIKVDVTPLPSSSSHLTTYQMKINNQTLNVSGSFDSNSSHIIHAFVNERSFTSTVLFSSGPSVSTSSFPPKDVTLYVNSDCVQFKLPTARFDRALGGQANVIRSPMAGKIVKVNATVGQKVTRGTPLLIMEAMKMEHVLRAPMDGIVATIVGHDGDFVEGGKVMITFEQKDEKKN
jgi:3-methylcrotonyl-CoA carboxylase alpha subunit